MTDPKTPETPTVERFDVVTVTPRGQRMAYGSMRADSNGGYVRYADHLTLLAEYERLREWKESAMAILGQWDALAEALKPHAQIGLGESVVEKLTEQIPPQLTDLARLRAEKEQIQAMNKGPVEQIQHIPLPRFVKTRFVHVGDCNEMIDKVTHKLTALQDAVKEWKEAEDAWYALPDFITDDIADEANQAKSRREISYLRLRALVDPSAQEQP